MESCSLTCSATVSLRSLDSPSESRHTCHSHRSISSTNLSHDQNRHVVSKTERTTKERKTMTKHMTGTREEWLAARLELLEAEKELTRRSDELARRRQELPWVRVDKEYRFEVDEGSASLADLFRGRSQLLVYHY